jgi:hypothetical protein
LDSFAHDLFAFMSTGARMAEPTAEGKVTPISKRSA